MKDMVVCQWMIMAGVVIAGFVGGAWFFFNTSRGATIASDEIAALKERLIPGYVMFPGDRERLPYRLFVPDNYSEQQRYPLILSLHGAGGRGSDNEKQLDRAVAYLVSDKVQRDTPAFVLVPQCPAGHQWVEIDDSKGPPYKNYALEEIPESLQFQLIFNIMENLLKTYEIDENRIYVTGFSMGGSGTWDIIVRHPDFFAAAVPLSGRNDPAQAGRIAHLPIWAFHGKLDDAAPVENTRVMKSALEHQGGHIRVSEPRCGHDVVDRAYGKTDVLAWMLAQERNP
jgi:predicted peptidase